MYGVAALASRKAEKYHVSERSFLDSGPSQEESTLRDQGGGAERTEGRLRGTLLLSLQAGPANGLAMSPEITGLSPGWQSEPGLLVASGRTPACCPPANDDLFLASQTVELSRALSVAISRGQLHPADEGLGSHLPVPGDC